MLTKQQQMLTLFADIPANGCDASTGFYSGDKKGRIIFDSLCGFYGGQSLEEVYIGSGHHVQQSQSQLQYQQR